MCIECASMCVCVCLFVCVCRKKTVLLAAHMAFIHWHILAFFTLFGCCIRHDSRCAPNGLCRAIFCSVQCFHCLAYEWKKSSVILLIIICIQDDGTSWRRIHLKRCVTVFAFYRILIRLALVILSSFFFYVCLCVWSKETVAWHGMRCFYDLILWCVCVLFVGIRL